MPEQESAVPSGCTLANHGNAPKFDQGAGGEIGSDLIRSSRLRVGGAEPAVIVGGEAEASEAEDQAGDEGGDVVVDGGHRAG